MEERNFIEEEPKQYIFMIGNPGVGKSTILNSLLGRVEFKSGLSLGKGLTTLFQLSLHTDGFYYGDTPVTQKPNKTHSNEKPNKFPSLKKRDFRT